MEGGDHANSRERASVGGLGRGVAADLGRGGHADLGHKRVLKQAEDLLLLDLLGRGVFGRRGDRWAFPELWAGRGGGEGGAWEQGKQRQTLG